MNNLTIMLFLAVLPILIILIIVYSKDKNKEPISLLLQFFCLGILSCFLVLILSDLLSVIFPFMKMNLKDMSFIDTLLYSFVGVALVEEFCKWIMLFTRGYNSKEFDETYDILVYSVFVSLGFAFFENIIYVFQNGKILTALLRAFSAIPGHACDAIFMGYYLSIAKQYKYKNNDKLEKNNIILSLVVPSILHGIYDFCLMANLNFLIYVFISFTIFLYIISINKLKLLADNNKKFRHSYNYCNNCGAKISGNICEKCGFRQE